MYKNLTGKVLKSIYHDWILGNLNQWNVNFDPHHENNFRKICNLQNENSSVTPIEFEVAFPRLPDLEIVPWEQILKVRESSASIEFRKNISDASSKIGHAMIAGEDTNEIKYHLQQWQIDQLTKELENHLSTPKKTSIAIGLSFLLFIGGFIPGISPIVSAASGIKDIVEPLKDLSDDRKSLGAAFIRKQKSN